MNEIYKLEDDLHNKLNVLGSYKSIDKAPKALLASIVLLEKRIANLKYDKGIIDDDALERTLRNADSRYAVFLNNRKNISSTNRHHENIKPKVPKTISNKRDEVYLEILNNLKEIMNNQDKFEKRIEELEHMFK